MEVISVGKKKETLTIYLVSHSFTNTVSASLNNNDFIAITDGTNKTLKEQKILQEPIGMSLNLTNNLLYVASGDSDGLTSLPDIGTIGELAVPAAWSKDHYYIVSVTALLPHAAFSS